MKVTIKEEKCMGCGSCPSLVPDVFDFNDDGFAYAKVDTVPEDLEDGVKEAIRNLNTFEKINLSKPLKNGYFFVKF